MIATLNFQEKKKKENLIAKPNGSDAMRMPCNPQWCKGIVTKGTKKSAANRSFAPKTRKDFRLPLV